MRRILVLAAVGALLAPASAIGVATPLAPAPGAVVETSHPVFTWSLPASEEPDGIYVANAPGTTVEGRLFDENVVDLDVFFGGETSWSPSSPLPAGTYWWNVRSHDLDSWTSYYSAPVSFTIPRACGSRRSRCAATGSSTTSTSRSPSRPTRIPRASRSALGAARGLSEAGPRRSTTSRSAAPTPPTSPGTPAAGSGRARRSG